MRKSKLVARVLVFAMAVSCMAGITAPDAGAAAAPKLSAKSKNVEIGSKVTLSVLKGGVKKIVKVAWKTSKKKVATVKKKGSTGATVTAVSKGTAKITATVNYKLKNGRGGKKNLNCSIKVIDKKASDATEAPVQEVPTATAAPATASPTAANDAAVPTATAEAPQTQAPAPTTKPVPTRKPSPTPYICPEDALKDYANFQMGTVVSYDKEKNCFKDTSFTALAKQQFDMVTFENEMKGFALIDTGKSRDSEDGMPVCNFERADEMVKWAVDNGLKVRGHVLCGDNELPAAFFYKDYDEKGELADADTFKKRLSSYFKQVVTHFEKEFPGEVIAWDVVNEAINAADDAEADEATGLYLNTTKRLYQILGGEYVEIAFQYAKEAVEEAKKINPNCNILLYYNDFNTFEGKKTDRIVALIKRLNSDPEKKLLDAMGMQGYVLTYWPEPSDVKKAMEKFAEQGVKIGINELTVRLNPSISADKNTITEADIDKHSEKYVEMFKVYTEFNKKNPGVLTNVSIWGLIDRPDLVGEKDKSEEERNYDYEIYGTNSGLLTEGFREKDVFFKVIEYLKSVKE